MQPEMYAIMVFNIPDCFTDCTTLIE